VRGRLNLFQAGMLRWRDLSPYNAVHVIRIDAPLDRQRLRHAIDGELAAFGLTGFELDRAHGRFEYRGGAPRTVLETAVCVGTAAEALRAEIERQINLPFPRTGAFDPFRFFAIDTGETFYLGLAYDHFIAAGDSIIALLAALADRYRHGGAGTDRRAAPGLYPAPYRRMLLRHPAAFLRGLPSVPAMAARFRRAFRPRYPHGQDSQNAFAHFRIERPGFDAMRRAAKAWGITLNDLLLAMILLTLAPLAAERRHAPRRRELAIAAIINIRADCGADARAVFGQFLSSFLVSHPVPPGVTLEQLARDVHRETARVKARKLYLQTLFAMGVAALVSGFLPPADRARFYSKSYPVWAGTTSLNVDALWIGAGGPAPPSEYLRAASTGPHAPLVAVLTAAGSAMHVGLSFRTAAFTREEIDKIATGILHWIDTLSP
jgi:hypothetical protein